MFSATVKREASEMKGDFEQAANRAGRKARRFLDSAVDDVSKASNKVAREIRHNPVRSSLIALGLGALLGAIARR